MSKTRILLTGDDGYQSLGTRLLVRLLKDDYDLTVAATVTQQSAVGGKMSLSSGFNWGITETEGVETFWVEGTPTDAMELMSVYQEKPFDLVISGVNWGANLGTGIYSSGTVNAAIGAITRRVAPHALAVSWDLPPEFYTMHHNQNDSLDEYMEYPGKPLKNFIDQAVEEKMWGAELLNLNFPYAPATEVKVTRLMEDVRQIYDYSKKTIGKEGHYSYFGASRVFYKTVDPVYDVRALTEGFISLTPCQVDLVHLNTYQKMQEINFKIQ